MHSTWTYRNDFVVRRVDFIAQWSVHLNEVSLSKSVQLSTQFKSRFQFYHYVHSFVNYLFAHSFRYSLIDSYIYFSSISLFIRSFICLYVVVYSAFVYFSKHWSSINLWILFSLEYINSKLYHSMKTYSLSIFLHVEQKYMIDLDVGLVINMN